MSAPDKIRTLAIAVLECMTTAVDCPIIVHALRGVVYRFSTPAQAERFAAKVWPL